MLNTPSSESLRLDDVATWEDAVELAGELIPFSGSTDARDLQWHSRHLLQAVIIHVKETAERNDHHIGTVVSAIKREASQPESLLLELARYKNKEVARIAQATIEQRRRFPNLDWVSAALFFLRQAVPDAF